MIQTNLNYLKDCQSNIDIEKLKLILLKRNRLLFDEVNKSMLKAVSDQPNIHAVYKNYKDNAIVIGRAEEIAPEMQKTIQAHLETFCPWRKGPFHIYGIEIDAEWRSEIKWNRIAPHMDNLENKSICDLGCNNGYFMFKAAASNPALVLGMDPTRKFKLAFYYLNHFAQEKNLHMELLGFEDLAYFNDVFDVLLCMGIIYHHENPVQILRNCHHSLKKGGQIILETMGISSKEEICLFPKRRYANMPNVWFIPSQTAAENMLRRSGFTDIKCIYNDFLDKGEQRKTNWARVESLGDFTDPDNPKRTIEGYEAPSRIYFTARKK
ncbi:MAG: tRNA 5-methoxyuridine(34)/uridine 5-oxyacetic acid(34) synthase CmoB [Spirochaetia bacterium]|nr:tRNA 5-methoxyuridine(34)/uridine 5-oxyacetic acid(34) synthase CmoB [Spirochaetia bacterium]